MRKQFKHDLVNPFDMDTEMIDGKRFYVLPSGEKFKSVTTLLSERLDKSGIAKWRQSVGEEKANMIMTQASNRGTAVHNIAENYLLNNKDYAKGEMAFNLDTFNQLKSVLDEHVDDLMGIEIPLYSRTLQCAGRTDLVAHYDGIPTIVDFKTSKKFKKEEYIEGYLLQSTVYSMMFEYHYKVKIPQIAIIIAVDHEYPQVFVRDRSLYVDRVIEVFKQ